MNDNDLSKSKIMNVNDFIFRQNLEFYPNLMGLSCADNTLIYQKNGIVIARVPLTFDLRTLPGEAWNVRPEEFLNIVNLNKDVKGLYKFTQFLQEHANDTYLGNVLGSEG